MDLPQAYIISKFHTYSTAVRQNNTYLNGCCPICHEGQSWGKKRRLYYILRDNYLYCQNCCRSWTPYFWVKEATGLSFKEIKEELKDYDFDLNFKLVIDKVEEKEFDVPALPGECVNLQDELQLKYYSNYFIVEIAKKYCESRKLFTALNAPKTYYVSLNDKYHKNRLVIPFYDSNNKIEYYITRKLLNTDTKAKYLMKFNAEKPVFNLSKIDANYPFIFIFEGQIDSMFVQNGVAISGVHLTKHQDELLTTQFPFHEKIWVFDNYRMEETEVKNIIIEKLKQEERVFLFDGEFSKFKDINDYCVEKNLNFVSPDLILNNSFRGQKGLLKIS